MKIRLKIYPILLVLMLALPFSALFLPAEGKEAQSAPGVFRIRLGPGGEIAEVPDREFLIGAVACEMPMYFCDEALKAQAVAAHTYYGRLRLQSDGDCDFSVDPDALRVYTDRARLQARWGEDFNAYYSRLEALVDEVANELLFAEDEPVCAMYCAISSGNTENPEDVFSGEAPGVRAVASPWDAFAPGFYETKRLSLAELCAALGPLGIDPSAVSPQEVFGALRRTPSGGVVSLSCCGRELSGSELRAALSLRSLNFSLTLEDNGFVFATKGWGHGVGMSQYGAQYLGEAGYSYREILAHYYPGARIRSESQ